MTNGVCPHGEVLGGSDRDRRQMRGPRLPHLNLHDPEHIAVCVGLLPFTSTGTVILGYDREMPILSFAAGAPPCAPP